MALDADFFCIQETKLQAGQISLDLPGYESYWSYAEKKGYSGTAVFTKHTPLSVKYNIPGHEDEGRALTLEYEDFFLVCIYTPNSQDGLRRIDYRMSWEDDLRDYLCGLDRLKPVIVCGDMNVAHEEIDLKNPSTNHFNPGFSDEERGGVLVVLHDVTQQRKAEERRREFVANVSHELRTPLTNIRSYAETIRDAGDELPRELENSFLDIVINESDRMTHIVQDLLTLSRLDSGRSEMNMARFDFGAAIDSVLRSIELEARRHGHELTHDYHDLPMIMGDRGRIEQVMLNVLGNAVKYTPDGGHIRVTAGTVGERVWMEVADDGIGIPKADRSRIFERFYRVDKARSRESGGTGLGLSIATEIVQRHNGTLSLVDREGPGTTVRLELPIRQSDVGGAQEGGNG